MSQRRLFRGVIWSTFLSVTAGFADPAPAAEPERANPELFAVVGYLPHYRFAKWSEERVGPLTDVVYFSITPTNEGRMQASPIEEGTLARLRDIKRKTGCRLHLCVGGGGEPIGFRAMAPHVDQRRAFADALSAYGIEAGFDGIDFDWEFPRDADEIAAFVDLVARTKKSLGAGRFVTVAQSPWNDFGRPMYELVDRVNVMSYNHKFPQARLEEFQADVQEMIENGCPREKLVLGIPFYGRNKQGKARIYTDLVRDFQVTPDMNEVSGFAFNGRDVVRAKVRYALEQKIGGVMIWEIGQDTTDPRTSLLQVIGEELQAGRTPANP